MDPKAAGLYDFLNEHDACGIGLLADLSNRPDRRIVELALSTLERMKHRGAAGGDAESGDGAGILTSLPDAFFRRAAGFTLPEKGKYAVGMLFGGEGEEKTIEAAARAEGLPVLGWRSVPVKPEAIGRSAREAMPLIRQLFVDGSAFPVRAAFERQLFLLRRKLEKSLPDIYFCSFSSRSIVYKGMLLATQLGAFYPDLGEADYTTPLAIVHKRFSTNTFPSWRLAHPFRFLAHNGEINTLRGNLNHLKSREPLLESELFGNDLRELLPLIPAGLSDSASLDNLFEFLVACGRDPVRTMLMLMPQAWGESYHLGRDVRAFFEYHSALMEPWDGPAATAFSDGVNAGAILDRNGLRPARYTLCRDGLFILASETGVVDIPPGEVVRHGRLRPGEMIWLDLENHRLVSDAELKNQAARALPYRRWVEENRISVHGLFSEIVPSAGEGHLPTALRRFGYTREDVETILLPMAAKGQEPVGSMGNDAAPAVLSEQPQLFFHYFKQLFAQVTNPPIDPIREELVMSLTTYIGNRGNILVDTPANARLVKLPRPVLTDDELERLRRIRQDDFHSATLPMAFGEAGLKNALEELTREAVRRVKEGVRILVLTDRDLDRNKTPIPSLLAVAAVNRALSAAGLRPSAGLIVQSGEVREVMHFALLLGYGATAVNPYLALAAVTDLVRKGRIPGDAVTAAGNYIRAVDKGLLKVMSKLGISTLRSYRSGQNFEAVGLNRELLDAWFPGTAGRIGGLGLEEIAAEAELRQREAARPAGILPSGGQYHYRKDGEAHLWNPESLAAFRKAVRGNDRVSFDRYSQLIDDQSKRLCTLRGLFELKTMRPIPLEEVESVEAILKHFVSGAMSLGSLSPEAHEAIAVAMNRLGAMSNCGEGGEDGARNRPGPAKENRASAIRQVASARFGVTIDYLRRARDLQIKMAQGAKPGEGGQLPGDKVDAFIARLRHSTPRVTLISPPPHHDIYSIEDLAQLIYDLRNANPKARISVKLVSEVGVGTVAAGVAKAHADVILVSGYDGGTGASPLSSIRHAGLPWELGLAEAQQTLVLNGLRSRVRLQTDGQLKTARDVVIAALLGAEEFGFATTLLVALGCIMMRKCHENSCPVGVATQDPERRKCFAGKPEYIENFLRFLAEDVRRLLAELGLPSLDAAVGRSDLLRMNRAIGFYKTKHLDFSRLLEPATGEAVRFDPAFRKEPLANFDRRELLPKLEKALKTAAPVELECRVVNVDRAVGTELSGEVAERYGAEGLPPGTVKVHFTGVAGQSFGAFLAPGIEFTLEGEANDYVGKGLSGGRIVVKAPAGAAFEAAANVIAGNVIGYGGTSGEIYLGGQAGERFAIRNSGVTLVVEGVGDHGCEYMTGGRVVVLGETGVNFAAGMTGGIAYVYDRSNEFDLRCNTGSVDLECVLPGGVDEMELLELIRRHRELTGSARAGEVLANWADERARFVKVFPVEYRLALGKMAREDEEAVDRTVAIN